MSNEKYDQEFAHAMALKLRLNREALSKATEPVNPSAPSGDFRQEMAQSIAMKRGASVEEVMEELEAFGF